MDSHGSEAGRFRAIVDGTPAAVVMVDADGAVRFANPAADRVLPRPPGDGAARDFAVLFLDASRVAAWLREIAAQGGGESGVIEATLRDGRVVQLRAVSRLDDPDTQGILLTLTDVSDYVEQLSRVRQQAFYDELTGLPSRTLLTDRLEQARRLASGIAVLIVDLDRFKLVNDQYGHAVGDQLLRALAHRMRRAVRSDTTVARMGGDEFVVLLPGADEDAAEAMAARLLEAIREPVPSRDGRLLAVSASIGIATTESGATGEQLLRHADVALFSAKAAGRDRWAVYRPDMAEMRSFVRRDVDRVLSLERENAELARLARTDEITGIPNVRGYFERLDEIHRAACRSGRPYSVVFCDLDRFGLYNKQRGEQAGDAALRAVAEALVHAARSTDEVYRRGGEELVVVLPDTDMADALDAAERLRVAVEQLHLPGAGADLPYLTLSAGVATFDRERHASPRDVEADADRAMMQAKSGGRNRIVAFHPDRPEE